MEKACSLTNAGIITIPTGARSGMAVAYLQGPYSLHPTVRSHSKWAFVAHSKAMTRSDLVHVVSYAEGQILPYSLCVLSRHHCCRERGVERRSRQEQTCREPVHSELLFMDKYYDGKIASKEVRTECCYGPLSFCERSKCRAAQRRSMSRVALALLIVLLKWCHRPRK